MTLRLTLHIDGSKYDVHVERDVEALDDESAKAMIEHMVEALKPYMNLKKKMFNP